LNSGSKLIVIRDNATYIGFTPCFETLLETVCFRPHSLKSLCTPRQAGSRSNDQFQVIPGVAVVGPAWSYNHMRIAVLGILNTGSKIGTSVVLEWLSATYAGFIFGSEAFLQAICCAPHCQESSHPR
jgi:hypothetical protein